MLGTTFPYTAVGKDKENGIVTDLFTFNCLYNQAYIIEIEHHELDIYVIKFFKKNHRHSPNRYNLVNAPTLLRKNNTTGAKNFLMILNTIVKIILDTYSENNKASFGFLGSPTQDELNPKKNGSNINSDGTVAKTKRYNVYQIYVKRYFSPEQFDHIEIETSSGYLIKSKNNLGLTTPKIENFFQWYITDFQ